MSPREELQQLVRGLRAHPSIRGKLDIRDSTETLGLTAQSPGAPGDDAAVLPRGDGYDLMATEGFINGFVQADPWFAGWCGVMVNISDILAMGGRPSAITNALWAPDATAATPVLAGMKAASAAYGVPIVGGHTNLRSEQLQLAVSIHGHANALITSQNARPGDVLLAAVDLRGAYRLPFDNWNAALTAPPERLRRNLTILPDLAEAGLLRAGKDISQGGIAGTAVMLAECSGVAMDIHTDALPLPDGTALEQWLRSFPSFGFLLSVAPEAVEACCAAFHAQEISAVPCGTVSAGHGVSFSGPGGTVPFWDYADTPYLGLAPKGAIHA
ncbi:MAG: sll0787 family AIR synthase-like protein [Mangrovicoccus sp.]|nr:sll0787 family AIR synthase-like protein [Mangrovicoccus sp.]